MAFISTSFLFDLALRLTVEGTNASTTAIYLKKMITYTVNLKRAAMPVSQVANLVGFILSHHWQSHSIDFPEKTRKQLRKSESAKWSLRDQKTLFSSKLNIPSPCALALKDICNKVDFRWSASDFENKQNTTDPQMIASIRLYQAPPIP
jgi:hypothetical protein